MPSNQRAPALEEFREIPMAARSFIEPQVNQATPHRRIAAVKTATRKCEDKKMAKHGPDSYSCPPMFLSPASIRWLQLPFVALST
jgi:hypothetical protein